LVPIEKTIADINLGRWAEPTIVRGTVGLRDDWFDFSTSAGSLKQRAI
jgi:hypothetical protein